MLVDIQLVTPKFSSFIFEGKEKGTNKNGCTGHRFRYSGLQGATLVFGKLKNILQYAGVSASRLAIICLGIIFILKYIIVLIQTTILYTTECNK